MADAPSRVAAGRLRPLRAGGHARGAPPADRAAGEMWTAAAMSREANCSYNQCFAFTLRGPAARSSPCAPRSIRSLRGTTPCAPSSRRTAPARRCGRPFSVEMPLIDLSALDPDAREARDRGACCKRECETPFDLAEGPLIRALRRARVRGRATVSSSPCITSCATGGRRRCCSRTSGCSTPPIASVSRLSSAPPRRTAEYVAEQTSHDARHGGRCATRTTGPRSIATARRSSTCPSPELAPPRRPTAAAASTCGSTASCTPRSSRPARRSGATLFATLLAAYEALVYRLSGQSDFVVGHSVRRTAAARELHARRPLRQHRAAASAPRPGGALHRAPAHRPRRSSPMPKTTRDSPSAASCAGCAFPATASRTPLVATTFTHRQDRRPVRLRRRDHRVARHAEVVLELRAAGERRRQRLGPRGRVRLQRGPLRRADASPVALALRDVAPRRRGPTR